MTVTFVFESTATELQEMLAKTRFEMVEYYDIDELEFIRDKSRSILVVARKIV